MKRILLLVLLLSAAATHHAQNTFAPLGAEWWHYQDFFSPNFGEPMRIHSTFHTRSVADTVVAGIPCRKVVTEINSVSSNFDPPYAEDYFFYDNTDTVFVYNKHFGRFTSLFVFNAQEGDTICLPVPPTSNPDLRINPISGDTSFCFVVDSVRLVQYDTAHLRTYYTRALIVQGSGSTATAYPSYNWTNGFWTPGAAPNTGRYIERIAGDFFPYRIVTCADCYSFTYAPFGDLRCYSDGTYSLKLRPEACDTLYPLAIRDLQGARSILKLYPNPAGGQFTIALDKPLGNDLMITITDVSGRVVRQERLNRKEQRKTITTGTWAEGLYLLRFQAGGQVYYDKITIRKRPE